MRVLQIIDSLNSGGAERVALDISKLLKKSGVEVSILTIIEPGATAHEATENQIELINLNRKGKFSPGTMYRLYRLMKDADIVHVHMRHTLKYVWLVNKLFFLGKPLVFHDHYGDIDKDKSVDLPLRLALKNTYYIGVCSGLCDWAIQYVRVPAQRVSLLSNIIVKQDIKVEHKPSDHLRFILVSNFRRTKNHFFAIELIQALMAQRHKVHLDIYGQIVNREYYEEIEDHISGNALKAHISVKTNCSNLQPVLHNYDMALHTADSETGPLVLIEYLSQGLPFLAYQTGEVPGTIKGDLPDFIINNFEKDKWLARVGKISGQYSGTGNQSITRVYHKYFDIDDYLNKCMAIYSGILESPRA